MKMTAFSSRVAKEIIRDPLSLIFGLCFPVVLLLLLSAINANVPVNVFDIEKLTPGTACFGRPLFGDADKAFHCADVGGGLYHWIYAAAFSDGGRAKYCLLRYSDAPRT